jgi:ribosome-associated protein
LTLAPNAPGAWEGTGAIFAGITSERTRECCAVAARAASNKLGRDTLVLGVEKLLGITDAFVVTSGANPRQVRTIRDEVERQLKLAGEGKPRSVEGLDDALWVLMDYGDFLVHVFLEEARRFYDLEHLWGDAPRWAWDERSAALAGAPG